VRAKVQWEKGEPQPGQKWGGGGDRCNSDIQCLMMEAASTSETSVNFYQTTRRNNSGDSHLHTCRRENLKPHLVNMLFSCYSSAPQANDAQYFKAGNETATVHIDCKSAFTLVLPYDATGLWVIYHKAQIL
jgi:hypothetical protein